MAFAAPSPHLRQPASVKASRPLTPSAMLQMPSSVMASQYARSRLNSVRDHSGREPITHSAASLSAAAHLNERRVQSPSSKTAASQTARSSSSFRSDRSRWIA
eukprot:scaffold60431_cov35-Tisochrysis_lutea.AAC.2